jgi:hypothetical protein
MSETHMHVFLSYSGPDKEFARRLADLMTQRGLTVFDTRHVVAGEHLADALRSEIEKASALIMLIPPQDASNRNWVWFEAGAARALGKRVLAVLPPARGAHARELPTNLADVMVLDADERPLEGIADMLVSAARATEAEAVAN